MVREITVLFIFHAWVPHKFSMVGPRRNFSSKGRDARSEHQNNMRVLSFEWSKLENWTSQDNPFPHSTCIYDFTFGMYSVTMFVIKLWQVLIYVH